MATPRRGLRQRLEPRLLDHALGASGVNLDMSYQRSGWQRNAGKYSIILRKCSPVRGDLA